MQLFREQMKDEHPHSVLSRRKNIHVHIYGIIDWKTGMEHVPQGSALAGGVDVHRGVCSASRHHRDEVFTRLLHLFLNGPI